MKYLLRIILDTLFPPTPHGTRLMHTSPEIFITLLHPTKINTHIALSLYEIADINAAVAACKFERNVVAAQLLATLFSVWLTQHRKPGTTLLVPIPLSHTRKRERGFNQVTRVLSFLPQNDTIEIAPQLLIRKRHTERQTSLNRKERLQNMQQVFYAQPRQLALIKWQNVTRVIICDDVLTTGATLTAATTALKPHIPPHVEVITLAWAH
jgi:ComF family protein